MRLNFSQLEDGSYRAEFLMASDEAMVQYSPAGAIRGGMEVQVLLPGSSSWSTVCSRDAYSPTVFRVNAPTGAFVALGVRYEIAEAHVAFSSVATSAAQVAVDAMTKDSHDDLPPILSLTG